MVYTYIKPGDIEDLQLIQCSCSRSNLGLIGDAGFSGVVKTRQQAKRVGERLERLCNDLTRVPKEQLKGFRLEARLDNKNMYASSCIFVLDTPIQAPLISCIALCASQGTSKRQPGPGFGSCNASGVLPDQGMLVVAKTFVLVPSLRCRTVDTSAPASIASIYRLKSTCLSLMTTTTVLAKPWIFFVL